MKMDGSKVFKMAVTRMQMLLEEALTVCGLRPEDLTLIVPHQEENNPNYQASACTVNTP